MLSEPQKKQVDYAFFEQKKKPDKKEKFAQR